MNLFQFLSKFILYFQGFEIDISDCESIPIEEPETQESEPISSVEPSISQPPSSPSQEEGGVKESKVRASDWVRTVQNQLVTPEKTPSQEGPATPDDSAKKKSKYTR